MSQNSIKQIIASSSLTHKIIKIYKKNFLAKNSVIDIIDLLIKKKKKKAVWHVE